MPLPAFQDAHILGYRSDNWLRQASIWLLYTTVWTPLCFGCKAGVKRALEDRRGFVSKNIFDGTTRHWYCYGGTDWGKSSLLKEGVADLIPDILAGKKSGFVMDGTELCDEIIAKLDWSEVQMRNHLIFVDLLKPGGKNDIGCLPRLNFMETSDGSGADDEFVEQAARISIFEMLFQGLFVGQQTEPQRALLSLAAQTMGYVENASLEKLKALLRAPMAFIEKLDDFEEELRSDWEQFVHLKPIKNRSAEIVGYEESPDETARALLRRVGGVTNSPVLSRLFCNSVATVNLAKRFNDGGVLILVATRAGKIMPAGARVAGRFMLTMLQRAVGARNSLGRIIQSFVAIDEFPNYLVAGKDDNLLKLLAEARKHGVSIWLLNQEEGQLSPAMLSALLENCHVITGGGMSPNMAGKVADKIGVEIVKDANGKMAPSIDLPKLKPKNFAAGVRGKKPMVLQSRKDPLGDKFHRLPKGAKGAKRVKASLARAHGVMRDLYAMDPMAELREAAKFAEPEMV